MLTNDTVLPSEIVIADDGVAVATERPIAKMAAAGTDDIFLNMFSFNLREVPAQAYKRPDLGLVYVRRQLYKFWTHSPKQEYKKLLSRQNSVTNNGNQPFPILIIHGGGCHIINYFA